MRLLSIDPGRVCTAYAVWDGQKLFGCGLSVLPEGRMNLAQVCHHHAGIIGTQNARKVVVEQMQVNKGRDSTLPKCIATANDLLELQAIGAFIAGRVQGELQYAPIGSWKGSAPKAVTRNRVEMTLQPSELELVGPACKGVKLSLHHNLYDAIGIGLWSVGRYVVRAA